LPGESIECELDGILWTPSGPENHVPLRLLIRGTSQTIAEGNPGMPKAAENQLRSIAVALAGLLMTLPALGANIHVPSDQVNIQDAITVANYGDHVLLAPGHYEVALELKGGITLAGTGARPEDTVLLGAPVGNQGRHKVAGIIQDARPLYIENLTIENGMAGNGGGLVVDDGCWVTLSEVVFIGNGAASQGGAIFAHNSHVEMYNCFFYGNYSLGGGGGSVHFEVDADRGGLGTSIIQNCTFAANSGCCGATSLVMIGGAIDVSNSIIENVTCLLGSDATFRCNNGDYCGIDGGGNFASDPRFCGFEYADCRLDQDSPCLPENNDSCGLIGAYGGCLTSATESISFSTFKALFR
jgi:predicted outer membrane repeat protein